MKKLIILISIIFLTGCTDIMNTPSSKVEEFLGKYQTMDTSIVKELDDTIEELNASDNYKKEYKSLLLKQYQNLSYKIKDEKIDNNTANVEVGIEVFDYYNTLERVKEDPRPHRSSNQCKSVKSVGHKKRKRGCVINHDTPSFEI